MPSTVVLSPNLADIPRCFYFYLLKPKSLVAKVIANRNKKGSPNLHQQQFYLVEIAVSNWATFSRNFLVLLSSPHIEHTKQARCMQKMHQHICYSLASLIKSLYSKHHIINLEKIQYRNINISISFAGFGSVCWLKGEHSRALIG